MITYNYYNNLKYPNVNDFYPTVNYSLNSDIFVNYINRLFKNRKSVCSINTDTINQHFIEIDVVDLTYKMSNNFYHQLNKCKSKNVRFIMIPINLRLPNTFENNLIDFKTTGHSNIIIIDNHNFTIELFEPHGKEYYGHLHYNLLFDIEKLIYTVILSILPTESAFYTFVNVYESCPYLGIQKDDSFCLAWSLFLAELKLLNPNINTTYIVTIISSWSRDFSINYIKKYIGYIETLNLQNNKLISAFSDYSINLNLSDIINPELIKQRILYLLNTYTNINNEIKYNYIFSSPFSENKKNPVLKLKEKLIFNELTSYQTLPEFHNIFLNYFFNYKSTILN